MRPDLWVIWTAIVIMCTAIGGSVGSRYFPSQDRLDAEYEAGRDDEHASWFNEPTAPTGLPGVARSATPPGSRAELADLEAAPRSELAAGGSLSGEVPNLGRFVPGEGTHVSDRTTAPLTSTGGFLPELAERTYPATWDESRPADHLAAEQAARMLPGPAMVPGEMPGQALSSPHEIAGPGADMWERLAADLDDDPDISEWSAKADAARCSEIVRELRQLARTLEAT